MLTFDSERTGLAVAGDGQRGMIRMMFADVINPFFNRRGRAGRRVILAMLLLATTTTLRAGSLADLDRDNGLADAKLGTPLGAFQGLQRTEDTGRWQTYKRPGDVLRYGKYEAAGITYNFFKERLYSINVDLASRGSVRGVLKLLENQYGKQHSFDSRNYVHSTAVMEIREWAGTKAYCVYKSSADFEGGVLTFVDRPTWDLLQVPKKEQQSQNREMLKGSFLNGDF